jgi:hypothetical protein|tara:strand:+ start:297 stop:530 length:234 start_codon:yes stop_codon:yes gene_type:complete
MKFTFEGKEFDDETLSNECKINVARIQNIVAKKNQLTLDYNELQVLENHYILLLRQELSKEELSKEELSKKDKKKKK